VILMVRSATRWLRLYGRPPEPRAVLAPHVALQLMDRRGLRSVHDVKRHRLVRVATKAFHFEIEVTSIEGVANAGEGCAGP
jgi:hypothetical protein